MIWILAGGLILVLFLAVRLMGTGKQNPEKEDNGEWPVAEGNVSCFMDDTGRVDIIPFSVDGLKRGKASDYPLVAETPYTASELGEIIRDGLFLSGRGKSLTSEELMKSLGYNDWKEYSKGKRSVSVVCRGEEVALNSTLRRNDGSYAFRVQGYEKVLPRRSSNQSLGKAVMELMKLSR